MCACVLGVITDSILEFVIMCGFGLGIFLPQDMVNLQVTEGHVCGLLWLFLTSDVLT